MALKWIAVLLALMGVAAVDAGLFMIYPPAAVVAGGIQLVVLAYALLYIDRQERAR